MALRCVLWDFGDTLVDERWMRIAPAGFPDWSAVWVDVITPEFALAWDTGEIGVADVVGRVAERLQMPFDEAMAHAEWCCSQIRFFAKPMEIARNSRLPQGIVTVNPDLFNMWVMPEYDLEQLFRPIITSWEHGSIDKGILCTAAINALDEPVLPNETLLIDNKQQNLDAWTAKGGLGYLFTTEEQFERDLQGDLSELARSV